jgi:hypothetical protein
MLPFINIAIPERIFQYYKIMFFSPAIEQRKSFNHQHFLRHRPEAVVVPQKEAC